MSQPPDERPAAPRYARVVGTGGIGTGLFFALEGAHDLGRDESRPARLLDVRDRCKLHIVAHYPAVLLGAQPSGRPFHVVPVGAVGDDDPGRRTRAEMSAAGMDVRFVRVVPERPTLFSVCFQYPDGSGGNITTSDSASTALRPSDLDGVADLLDAGAIALALPEAPLDARHALLRLAGRRGALRVAALATAEVEAARAGGLLADADLLAMNAHEAAALAGERFPAGEPERFLAACARAAAAASPRLRLVVTAGARGAWGFEDGVWTHTPAVEVAVASTAGAGDALLGGILAALALGAPLTVAGDGRPGRDRPLESALDFGVLLGSYAVTSPHTIHPDARADTLAAFARAHGLRPQGIPARLLEGRPEEGSHVA